MHTAYNKYSLQLTFKGHTNTYVFRAGIELSADTQALSHRAVNRSYESLVTTINSSKRHRHFYINIIHALANKICHFHGTVSDNECSAVLQCNVETHCILY